ncbi:MAG: PDZ domain-containing protein [Anaerolineaceae bacterium]|nr:PDZ domain-containing protein [Anaerolineaceae bacterium]
MQRNLSLLLSVVLVVLVMILGLGNYVDRLAADENKDEVYRGIRLLDDVSRLIRKYYVSEVDNRKLYENAAQGMLQGQDRFSSFIAEDELPQFTKHIKGQFGGIGIVIGQKNGWLMVISPIEDGPSFRAGVMAGDRFIRINDKSTDGMSLDAAVKLLTGKPGTKVTFELLHEATLKKEKFTITREIIHIKTVKGLRRDDQDRWDFMVDKDAGIAYVRVTSFTNDTVTDLKKAIEQAKSQGMKSLILDLRFNGGGVLEEGAVAMVDLFIEQGVIVSTRGRVDSPEIYKAKKKGTLENFPMVILVNDRSASASEIVAGSLQDHNRAIVVGERTFGKGSVQRILPVEDGRAAVRLTVAKYYLPSGRCLHRDEGDKVWGVDPLIEVKMTPREYADVFMARRESEVIHGNGKKTDDGEPEQPKDEGREEKKKEDTPESRDDQAPPGSVTESEDQGDQADKTPVDRQLDRAIDVLKMWPKLKQFDQKQVVEIK